MFILHAAIVPTCVGLYAASSMAHWCQFFPVLVCAARRAANRLARWWQGLYAGDGALLVCMCVLLVWHSLAKPACSMQVLVTGVCMCTFVCRCPWDPWSCVLPALFTQVGYLPYHAAAVVGRGFVIPGCVPGLVCPCCVYLYVSGGGRTCAVLIGPSPLVSMRIHMHGGCCRVCSVQCALQCLMHASALMLLTCVLMQVLLPDHCATADSFKLVSSADQFARLNV